MNVELSYGECLQDGKYMGHASNVRKTRNHSRPIRGKAAQARITKKAFQRIITSFFNLYGRIAPGELEFCFVVRSVAVNNGANLLICESPMLEVRWSSRPWSMFMGEMVILVAGPVMRGNKL